MDVASPVRRPGSAKALAKPRTSSKQPATPGKKPTPKKPKPKAAKKSQRGEPIERDEQEADHPTGDGHFVDLAEEEEDEMPADVAALLAEALGTPRSRQTAPSYRREADARGSAVPRMPSASSWRAPAEAAGGAPSPVGAEQGDSSPEVSEMHRWSFVDYSPPPKPSPRRSVPPMSLPTAPPMGSDNMAPGSARRQMISARLSASVASARGDASARLGGTTPRAVTHAAICESNCQSQLDAISDAVIESYREYGGGGEGSRTLRGAGGATPAGEVPSAHKLQQLDEIRPVRRDTPANAKPSLPFAAEIVKKGALAQIETVDRSSLRHVESRDRSTPMIEEGVTLKPSPATHVFAQIASGTPVKLRHVADISDRSAPLIEADVRIRTDVRPSLFAQIQRRLGFGPTGAGAKRGWD